MDYIYIIVGLICLIIGGEYLVRGAIIIAQKFNISPMIIGLTLVGFGTSTPELVTSLQAALNDAPGIAVGNVVGSNIANILLILGVAAIITPIAVNRPSFKRDGTVLVLATSLCVGVILYGSIGRITGAAFLVLLTAYLVGTIYFDQGTAEDEGTDTPSTYLGPAALTMFAGLTVTIFGAKFLVNGAISVANGLGVSEAVIGLTVVAVGTSMPELVTSMIAARKGQVEVALGNVIGSNIFNILGILGATVLVKPLVVPMEIATLDIWVMAVATLALCWVAITGWKVSQREGLLLVTAYVGYIGYLVLNVAM
ncbi:MAG: cation:H+ antiporter [Yoonia sp.]|jgi:cation:H+ antiporter